MEKQVLELFMEKFLKEKGYQIIEPPETKSQIQMCKTLFMQAKVKTTFLDPWVLEDRFNLGLFCLERGVKNIGKKDYYVHIDFKRIDSSTAYIIGEFIDYKAFNDEETFSNCFWYWY